MRLTQVGEAGNDREYAWIQGGFVEEQSVREVFAYLHLGAMMLGMRYVHQIVLASMLLPLLAHACDFKTEPAAVQRFYRSDGWTLPALAHNTVSAPVNFVGPGSPSAVLKFGPGLVPGMTTRVLFSDTSEGEPNVFEIPRQEFEQEGRHHVMSPQLMAMSHTIWRYDVQGKVVAYTVGLTPINAHRANGKWRVDDELSCTFYATFLDDKGDGVFRVLIPGWMTPDFIPEWAADRKKNPA